jgi:hypothetical protein
MGWPDFHLPATGSLQLVRVVPSRHVSYLTVYPLGELLRNGAQNEAPSCAMATSKRGDRGQRSGVEMGMWCPTPGVGASLYPTLLAYPRMNV